MPDLRIVFEPVPPPKKAPVQDTAKNLNLVAGLRAEETDRQFRCAACRGMSRDWRVWVPDGVLRSDPEWSVTESCRLNAYNGHRSAWCLDCAPKHQPEEVVSSKRNKMWSRVFTKVEAFLPRWLVRIR